MAAAPVKSQPLHNFTLPSFLKWGGGKNNGSTSHSRYRRSPLSEDSPPPPPPAADNSEAESDRNDSESELRAHRIGSRAKRNRFPFTACAATERRRKQAAAEAEKEIIVEKEEDAGKKRDGSDEAEETVQKPWNLRPRRGMASSKAPGFDQNGESQETMSPASAIGAAQQVEAQPKSLRLRGFNETVAGEKNEKRKFWIALSREEIEEDIFVMTGSRPARRPKKRQKNVQKQLDNVFPGLWLVGVSADAFRVAENLTKVEMHSGLEMNPSLVRRVDVVAQSCDYWKLGNVTFDSNWETEAHVPEYGPAKSLAEEQKQRGTWPIPPSIHP